MKKSYKVKLERPVVIITEIGSGRKVITEKEIVDAVIEVDLELSQMLPAGKEVTGKEGIFGVGKWTVTGKITEGGIARVKDCRFRTRHGRSKWKCSADGGLCVSQNNEEPIFLCLLGKEEE